MSNKKIHVGNLSPETTQQQLEETFSQFGELEEIRVIMGFNTGRSKGFAFLTYKTIESAETCLSKQSIELDGRLLRVSIAQDKSQNKSSHRSDRGL